MTYEDAVAKNDEAKQLRQEILERGLLKVYVDPVYVSHEMTRDEVADEVVGIIECGERNYQPSLLRVECSVCEKAVYPGHNCIGGSLSEKQLRRIKGELGKGALEEW